MLLFQEHGQSEYHPNTYKPPQMRTYPILMNKEEGEEEKVAFLMPGLIEKIYF